MDFENRLGATPLYRAAPNLFLKLEYTNPTGSVKDRAAWEMVADAEKRGLLRPNGVIIEPTSGNTGISLAALAAERGYACVIVMPESMSVERREKITFYGARVVLTSAERGMAGAVETARELADRTQNAWIANQFENPANAAAHYRTTGPEIWAQTDGKADILVAGVGTGGTITGTGRFLKAQNAAIRVVAVEPEKSPLLSMGHAGKHGIEGIGANFLPAVLDVDLLDEIVRVTDEAALASAKALAGMGIFAGLSSGAAYFAAREIAARNAGKTVVAILPDAADRYRSVGLSYDG